MRTTIDSAGRIVVPKAMRDAMGLTGGREVDIVFTDGRIEVEIAPAEVRVEMIDGVPALVSEEALPPLDDETIRATLEGTRR